MRCGNYIYHKLETYGLIVSGGHKSYRYSEGRKSNNSERKEKCNTNNLMRTTKDGKRDI